MALESYRIDIDTRNAIRAVNDLQTALTALATGAVVTEFVKLSDTITQLTNRLSQVTQEGQSASAMFDQMTGIANSLGAPVSAVSDLFFKLAINTRDVSMSQKELAGMTSTLYKELILTGESAAGAQSAILQLTQAFAKGRPDAMEMRSILEHMPDVAKAMSERLGVTSGVLRLMASDGKISADTIKQAITDASSSIDEKWGNSTRTIEQSLNVFSNTISVLVKNFNDNTGAAQALSIVILDMAIGVTKITGFFKEWGGVILDVVAAFLAFTVVGKVMMVAEGAVIAFGEAVTATRVAVAGWASYWEKFQTIVVAVSDSIGMVFKTWAGWIAGFIASIGSFLGLEVIFGKVSDYFKSISDDTSKYKDAQKELKDSTKNSKEEQEKLAESLDPVQKRINELNGLLGLNKENMSGAAKETDKLSTAQYKLQQAAEKSVEALNKQYRGMKQSMIGEIQGIGLGAEQQDKLKGDLDRLNKYEEAVAKLKEDAAKEQLPLNDANVVKGLDNLKKAYDDAQSTYDKQYETKLRLSRANEKHVFDLQQIYAAEDKLNSLYRETAKVGLSELAKQYADIRFAADEAANAELRAMAARRGTTVENLPPEDVAAVRERAAASVQRQEEAQRKLNDALAIESRRQAEIKKTFDVQVKLKDLQEEINKTVMTDTAAKYADIEYAANRTAEAEIAAEEQRRGTKLPIEEAKEYYRINLEGLDKVIAKTSELIAAQEKLALAQFKSRQENDINAKLRSINDDINKASLTEIEKKYYDIDAAAREAAENELNSLAARKNMRRDELDAETVKQYYKAALDGTQQLKQATKAQYDNSRTFATGWKQALNQYTEDATNAAQQAKNIFQKTTKGMEDMIVNFAKTGKFEWKSFVSSIVEELLRSQITVLFSNILNGGGTGGGAGGILGSIMGLFGVDTGSSGGTGSKNAPMGTTANNAIWVRMAGMNGGAGGGNPISNAVKQATGSSWLSDLTDLFTGGSSSKSNSWIPEYSAKATSNNGQSDWFNNLFSGSSSNNNLFGDVTSGLGNIFDGWFANGGQIGAGKFGIVGEAGPEIVTGPANVMSNQDSFGGSTNITYNINAVDALSFKQLVASDPSFIYAVSMQGSKSVPRR